MNSSATFSMVAGDLAEITGFQVAFCRAFTASRFGTGRGFEIGVHSVSEVGGFNKSRQKWRARAIEFVRREMRGHILELIVAR